MTLWILGANGQVGRAIARAARAASLHPECFDHAALDIRDEKALNAAIGATGVVVNAAAYTAVDQAESEPQAAFSINRDGAALVARIAERKGLPVIHFSTDYVFDGKLDRPYREDDALHPLSVYGRSKAEGEAAVRRANPHHIILRASWIYDARGRNFVRTMLRLGGEREEIGVVDDQRGGPTSAADIAALVMALLPHFARKGFAGWGTYHFQGGPPVTWAGFAAAILAGRSAARIRPIRSEDYPTPAARPRNSVFDCALIQRRFEVAIPDWRRSLTQVLAEIDMEKAA